MEKTVVNAVGDACPLPVVKAIKALGDMKQPGVLEVLVDNETAVQNVQRMFAGRGLGSAVEKKSDKLYVICAEVGAPVTVSAADAEAAAVCSAPAGNAIAVFDTDVMGRGDDELGRALMKGFIYALSQLPELPAALLFYNGGARLTTQGSVSVQDLKSMEEQGVEILTCGTCLNHYGLADKLEVGSVTNMYTIVEKMTGASRIIKP